MSDCSVKPAGTPFGRHQPVRFPLGDMGYAFLAQELAYALPERLVIPIIGAAARDIVQRHDPLLVFGLRLRARGAPVKSK
ncbi:hypothetical protein WR25_13964 [Diploscapter pachys]|uniref:Uncharacterized protein n=1 Tax=Diploscapter pachys TaxID=2018661 RepID=A0A2A2JYQ7_9BILA|nr:hypothetical protein WR25_13964 [Diploscapter pachys]